MSDSTIAAALGATKTRHKGAVPLALALVLVAGCRGPSASLHEADGTSALAPPLSSAGAPGGVPPTPLPSGPPDAPGVAAHPAPSAGYPIDSEPPKDFFDDDLLRTLAHEAAATIVCRLRGLTNISPQEADPDTFYDASCDVVEARRGPIPVGPIHFIWQVERGSRMPPLGSDLLVFLKARHERLEAAPSLKWVALDTGVLRYTAALQQKLHHQGKGR